MNIVKVCWSGGKDSTCSVLLHLEQGDYVKAVCYIPMFTKNIPLITKKHYDFIINTADRLREMGAEVYIVSGMTYYDYITHRVSKGETKGKIMGFVGFIPKQCPFKNYSKIKAIKSVDVGTYDFEDIGIAYDEPQRQAQLTDSKRSILVEKQFTEKMAKQKCIEYNMLSPHYDNDLRDGCTLCPNAPKKRRLQWFKDYPEAMQLVIDLQEIVKRERPDRPPLRQHKYFIDTDQIDLFGNYTLN